MTQWGSSHGILFKCRHSPKTATTLISSVRNTGRLKRYGSVGYQTVLTGKFHHTSDMVCVTRHAHCFVIFMSRVLWWFSYRYVCLNLVQDWKIRIWYLHWKVATTLRYVKNIQMLLWIFYMQTTVCFSSSDFFRFVKVVNCSRFFSGTGRWVFNWRHPPWQQCYSETSKCVCDGTSGK